MLKINFLLEIRTPVVPICYTSYSALSTRLAVCIKISKERFFAFFILFYKNVSNTRKYFKFEKGFFPFHPSPEALKTALSILSSLRVDLFSEVVLDFSPILFFLCFFYAVIAIFVFFFVFSIYVEQNKVQLTLFCKTFQTYIQVHQIAIFCVTNAVLYSTLALLFDPCGMLITHVFILDLYRILYVSHVFNVSTFEVL